MIDHSGVSVSDVARSKAFYKAALAPLGYAMLMEFEQFAGFGVAPKPDFWIGQGKPNVPPVHIAFHADSRAIVDAFYRAALEAGGRDNGPPGLRPHYHENYYGAFVLDPDGHNIEAVCHGPK
jgi:catechol 2,3-dioxygenase-like lactoylglutathione lyase family enzyme